MRKVTASILVIIIAVMLLPLGVFAEHDSRAELSNDYYITYTIIEEASPQIFGASESQVKTGKIVGSLRNSSGEIEVSVTLTANFRYDGKTAEALTASYTYNIYESGWSFKSGNCSYQNATAKAEVLFSKFLARDAQVTVTLTCSPTGVLS